MDGVVGGFAFGVSALAGIGGLWLLHRGALGEAMARAGRREAQAIERMKEAAADAAGRLSDTVRMLEAANATRRALEDEMRAKDAALGAAADELAPFRAGEAGLRARLDAMEAVWFDAGRSEEDCQRVLADNLWVLMPDYVVGPGFHANGENWLSTAFEKHFDRPREDWVGGKKTDHAWRLRVGAAGQPDFCGRAKATAGFGGPDDVYLIVELKKPGIVIGWDHIEQAHAYALSLMMNVGPDILKERRFDCLVIGSGLAEDTGDAHLRWGKEAHHAIRIVPMTYRRLYERAKLIAAPFLERALADPARPYPPIAPLAETVDEADEAEAVAAA